MTEVVLDASVIVKWALPDRAREAHAERALNLLQAILAGRLTIVEPPHWLAEVAAVVTRLAPDRVAEVVALMHAMEFPVLDELEVYLEAAACPPIPVNTCSTPCITPWPSAGAGPCS